MFSDAKCFPISHQLLLMFCIILDDCFSSVTDPALGISNRNRRFDALKVTHLLLIASTFLAFAEGVVSRCVNPRKGSETVKRLHGEREANRVNCYVKSATVNCGPGRPPYSLPVPEGNSSPDGIFLEAVTHKRLAPTKNKVHRLRLINLLL